MKRILNSIAGIFIMLEFISCQTNSSEVVRMKKCSLTIVLNTTYEYGLLDSTVLSGKDFVSSIPSSFDTVNHRIFYHWDSLLVGEYAFKIQSIFSKEKTFNISFSSDTSIVLPNEFTFTKTKQITKQEMYAADTIELLYEVSGCFGGNKERTILINKNGVYAIQTPSGKIKNARAELAESIYQLQIDSKKQQDAIGQKGIIFCSTNSQRLYILVHNKLFRFSDYGLKDWNLYTEFSERYLKDEHASNVAKATSENTTAYADTLFIKK